MRPLLIASLLLATTILPAQTSSANSHDTEQLRFTLILSRHGVRPPTVANASINRYSADPWPTWDVAPGYLTAHGGVALRRMGAYMRLDFARKGLLPASGCLVSGEVYLYADTDERNIMSTRNTDAGLDPGCDPLPVHTIASSTGIRDPLFSPVPGAFPAPSDEALAASRKVYLGNDPAAFYSVAQNPELKVLAHILAPDPAHPAAEPILDNPKPLAVSMSLIEDLLLEYTDGKPMSIVGWGRVDELTLRRLIPLETKDFSLNARTPLTARTSGSNLLAHMLDTLEQSAQAEPVPGAIGPTGTRLVYMSAHDSNLYYIGGLLGLHWTVEGFADDTPPDAQLVFELWQNPKSKQSSIRLYYRAQTINQLRLAQGLTLASPPAEVRLTPPGCQAGQVCPLAAFDKAARARLDPAYVMPNLMPIQIAPANP
jgi:4-phytase/acid phosphatase